MNDSIKSYENNDGTKTLEFKLKGTQTKYNNAAAKGAYSCINNRYYTK